MENKEALQTVKEIKTMMEQSSKFLSFSGLSAILIGFYALFGAYAAHEIISESSVVYLAGSHSFFIDADEVWQLCAIAVSVFLLALATVLVLSWKKARRIKSHFFNRVTYRAFLHFFLPLVSGGILCAALIFNGYYILIAPAMLLFYGLSLVDVSKYTHNSIFWLGCSQLCLGSVCAFLPGCGLLFWAVGFGLLHIVYGIYYCFSVERRKASGNK